MNDDNQDFKNKKGILVQHVVYWWYEHNYQQW